mmetsp:Transcript_79944/g.222745  ORF Transcript_79944/g.222745 Transcript_79944/m.222745 type:complete len:230 (-) Transcript_79944:290-979(-)
MASDRFSALCLRLETPTTFACFFIGHTPLAHEPRHGDVRTPSNCVAEHLLRGFHALLSGDDETHEREWVCKPFGSAQRVRRGIPQILHPVGQVDDPGSPLFGHPSRQHVGHGNRLEGLHLGHTIRLRLPVYPATIDDAVEATVEPLPARSPRTSSFASPGNSGGLRTSGSTGACLLGLLERRPHVVGKTHFGCGAGGLVPVLLGSESFHGVEIFWMETAEALCSPHSRR